MRGLSAERTSNALQHAGRTLTDSAAQQDHIPLGGRRLTLAHTNLPHELVLVPVHASQLADMAEDVLEPVCQLEGIHIAQPELQKQKQSD